jgi:hypothetical protein
MCNTREAKRTGQLTTKTKGGVLPKAPEHKRENLLSVTDLAIRNSAKYGQTRDEVLRGAFGRPVRIGSRLFVVNPDLKPAA